TPVNDAPILITPYADVSVAEDTAIDIAVPSSAFGDADGDVLTVSVTLANGDPLPAWLTFANGHLTGTPPANFNGALDFAVTASDGIATASDTFRLAVAAVNDAPVLVTPYSDVTVNEDTTIDILIPTSAFSDADGDPLTLSLKLANGDPL